MGLVSSSTAALSGVTAGYTIVDVPYPGVTVPVINSYTTLAVPAYWRAINFKARNMASFPRSVRKNDIDVPHRLDRLLKRKPNGYQSAFILWQTLYFHKYHYGNAYASIERDTLFNPVAIHNLPPEIVSPFRWIDDDGTITQWYHVASSTGNKVLPASDVIHLAQLSYDGLVGINHVWLQQEAFERARLVDRYITRYLVKGSVIRAAIEIDAAVSEDQVATIVSTMKKYRGADGEDDVPILTGGAKFANKSANNDQSQIIQLSQLSTKQIAQLTDVAPHWLFDSSEEKYNGNPVQAGEDAVRYLFRIEIEQAEDEMIKLLSDPEQDAGYTIHIDPNALIRGDVLTESDVIVAQTNAGLLSKNEGRLELGYPPSDDPKADALVALGDTSKPVIDPDAKQTAAAPPRPTLEQFAAILSDVASRVGKKTDKATETHKAKIASDPEAWTAWGNVFAEQQANYAAESLAPLLETIQAVTGAVIGTTAEKIGSRYATGLRAHFATLKRSEPSVAPDLFALIQSTIQGDN